MIVELATIQRLYYLLTRNKKHRRRLLQRKPLLGSNILRILELHLREQELERVVLLVVAEPQYATDGLRDLPYKGHNSQKPTRPNDSSTPQLPGNQSPQDDTPHHYGPVDSIEHAVEGNSSVGYHGLSGQQHSVRAANEGTPWMPSNGSLVSPGPPAFVSGQDTPDGRGVLAAVNRLPLPSNPDTGLQVIPPIDQILKRRFVRSNLPAFPGRSQQH
ncbi:uncharacterized protein LDX57_003284 [Aspergillus melleus]|uniref:uncharacterized protein n=1 Tax=Aspergillus melleus TaxID=138277 RepID=UPI001E8EDFB0|nr:uncharacterized protein LDX57_003284 [Aspergillus melleus]KAH8425533.1 hypothetical protein LDX57_003284 [Aspergillus melleus]